MARFIDTDEAAARASLGEAGVRLLREDDAERSAAFLATLGPDSRFDRVTVDIDPPSPGTEFEAFGAWHVNNVREFHSVESGLGIIQFMTDDGTVSVLLEAGDVMAVDHTEHRYRPLTTQRWTMRYDGGVDGELVAAPTGREPQPWPDVI